MAEQSQTSSSETGAAPTTPTTPPETPPTSSTTPPQATPPSSETPTEGVEKTLLNTEAKPPEGEAKPEDKKPEDKAKPEGAPEKYEDFKVPEGYQLDKTVAENATALFKKHGLTQAAAQELVDFYSKHAIESSQTAVQAVKDMRAGWVKEVRESPDFRSDFTADGKLKPDSKLLVGMGRMLDSLGDAKLANDFRAAMDFTGAGDHPAFIRVMAKLAEHFSEGSAVRGNAPSPHGQSATGTTQRKGAAQEMYPNLPSANG